MIETAIKANTVEANRLYQRGIAAARGGQRRIAVGLLTRAVQLDPQNENAWLWLSGVLDEPHHISFCLNSVLKINPGNERALQGLDWLKERQLLQGTPTPASLLTINIDTPKSTSHDEHSHHESWWVKWRQSRREMNYSRIVIWSVPFILLCFALILHQTFARAIETNLSASTSIELSRAIQREHVPEITTAPLLESETSSIRESLTIGYLGALDALRQQLRDAVDSYLNATERPGNASVGHVTAAQKLRDHVAQVHTAMRKLTPPHNLQAAHDDYQQGLVLELEAIDYMVAFYGSYKVELANRAALRFQQASDHISRAKVIFDSQTSHMTTVHSISIHTIR